MRWSSVSLGIAVALAGLAAEAADARADQVRYVGLHPIAEAHGGGVCHIEAPHVHVYRPQRPKLLYRVHDGHFFFVGDPRGHGFEGEVQSYYGHHPIEVHANVGIYASVEQVEYCYLDGPHHHAWVPAPGATFTVHGGLYWYTGEYPPAYRRDRPRYAPINRIYAQVVYPRPVVEVEPPAAYLGPVVEVRVGGPRAGIAVEAPSVSVEAGVGVEVGVGVGVGVGAGAGVGARSDRPRPAKKRPPPRKNQSRRSGSKSNRYDFRR